MADNIDVTPGTGATVAADDISSVLYQRVKLSLGADGTAVDAGAGAGAVDTDTQRVTLGSDDPAVTSLAIVDDWDESDRAKVNVIAGQAGVDGGSGTVSAATQRVVLATDVALPAGTNAIGKLAANSGVDIGDVDVTSLPALAAGTNLIGRVSSSHETSTIYNGTTALTPKFAKISCSSSGANEIVAAVTSKKIRVLAWDLSPDDAVNAKWQSHTAGDITGLYYMVNQGNGQARNFNPAGWFETTAGEALDLNLSGSIAVGGALVYVEV